jgi:hypothetical protein
MRRKYRSAAGIASLALAVLSNKVEEFTRRLVSHFLPRWSFAALARCAPITWFSL